MRTVRNLVAVGILGFVAIPLMTMNAQAGELPARGPIPFANYDQNGDGLISEAEFNATRAERTANRAAEGRPMRGAGAAPAFSDFDSNGDGSLTPDELAAGRQLQQQKRPGRGPASGRGRGGNMPAFADYDLDGDGRIHEQEFLQARNNRIAERAKQGYQMRNLGSAPAFADIDADGNGAISPAEFSAHQAQHRQQRAQ